MKYLIILTLIAAGCAKQPVVKEEPKQPEPTKEERARIFHDLGTIFGGHD